MGLKYSIPDFLYSILFPLTNQQCHSLAEIGIIKITCHKYVHKKKQLPDNELKKLHDSPIDIYDPLWYENTSTPLHEACWRGLKDEVLQLIDKTGLQERGKNGWSPPLAASYGGHIDVLTYSRLTFSFICMTIISSFSKIPRYLYPS
uniref:SOCS box domain-containing protein n=1 Tax=Amphimedon queenslandica TaxID=400682 RepID=A0A1X7UFS2_AMPQE